MPSVSAGAVSGRSEAGCSSGLSPACCSLRKATGWQALGSSVRITRESYSNLAFLLWQIQTPLQSKH